MATSLEIDDAIGTRIRNIAGRRERTPAAIVDDALRQYLDREEARDAFLQEADASLDDFRANGQHLTADEVSGWLATWGALPERGPPECHD